jgi:2-oxoglutarate dehydrogenase E2 component (dihydrolipoamide succinyltransferase)
MSHFEIVMPKLGESIIEATITKWLKKVGDHIEEDEDIVEIATDKVDSEIPSPVEGTLAEILFKEGDIVAVGKVIAVIDLEGGGEPPGGAVESKAEPEEVSGKAKAKEETISSGTAEEETFISTRFYSPLVKNMARQENISVRELDKINGTGKDGRVTKNDLLDYIKNRGGMSVGQQPSPSVMVGITEAPKVTVTPDDQIIEMDRMRCLIADHMVMSKRVSPHVTSFIEADVTTIAKWRDKMKDMFYEREGEKLTFTPFFVEAAARALKDYPGVNASVDGYRIILRKHINIGIATALPSGNLIVPVIKDAGQKNLLGLAKAVNDLSGRARNNTLNPDDIQEGTFTITNFGTVNSLSGVPIINQPQVAILGIGVIKKRPVVMETADGDVIAIRHIIILSLSYDHRAVDGALGGMYLDRVARYLENFDNNTTI